MNHVFLNIGMGIAITIALWLLCWLWQLWKYRGTVEMANAIPVEHCRRILGKDCGLTDGELGLLRDQLYALARVAVEACPRQRRGEGPHNAPDAARRTIDRAARVQVPQKPAGFPDAVAMLPEDDRYDVEERAAIMEHDGGLKRDMAERAAMSTYWRSKHRGN